MPAVNWITLDPAHFHAALVQKEMYPQISPRVHVYAPLGPDLIAHLTRITGFNNRADRPTTWELEVHADANFSQRVFQEKPGNVVVLSGRNHLKIDYIEGAIQAGLNVLADKPWLLVPEHLPRLQRVLDLADEKGLLAYDIMTERHEITSILQRELVGAPDVFGAAVHGTEAEPGVFMESVHYLCKTVAGVPLRRPPWYFEVNRQGEGLNDVGTHLVDLVPWILFPNQPLEIERDLALLAARRWPTVLSQADYQKVTGEPSFPKYLEPWLEGGKLQYYGNTAVSYRVRGVQVTLNVLWDFEAAPGCADTHRAVFRGTRSRVEVRQEAEQKFKPELYVVPTSDTGAVRQAVQKKVNALQERYPGVGVEDQGERTWVTIPERYRTGHEAHFGAVTRAFLGYLDHPRSLPAWEKPNMVAKYFVTTKGVEMSRG